MTGSLVRWVVLVAAVVGSWGCSEEGAPAAAVPVHDASVEPEAADEPDAPSEAAPDAEGPDPTLACEELQLASTPFVDAPEATALRALAADLTVPTTRGDWNLRSHWSGCDVHLFIQDAPKQNKGNFDNGLWDMPGDLEELFAAAPKNVQFFFTSTQADATARAAALGALQVNIEAALGALTPEEQSWWAERVHYVTVAAREIPGWVGKLMLSPGWGAAIDRFQRIRYIGSYADPTRFDSGEGWFGPNVSMVANEAVYYNFEAAREARLEAQNATVVGLWAGTKVAETSPYVTVTLPEAATLAQFDTLELDLSLTCGGKGEFGVCPAWDYDAYLHLCEEPLDDAGTPGPDAGPSSPTCPHELGHWITSYHREGRWVHDVSGVLPLLAQAGSRQFKFTITDPWVVDLKLRFSSSAKLQRPAETLPLFAGQYTLDEAYNDNYSPLTLAIPADAAKVELASVITGHGMSSPGNCAEFCNTDHHFVVNGTDNKRDFPIASSALGCMGQVADGTVPNQYGTWWYGRAGWCPGKHVEMVMTDITAQVVKGADNQFEYKGFYKGKPYLNGSDWRHIHLASWVVISR
jgi:hypothetical protein